MVKFDREIGREVEKIKRDGKYFLKKEKKDL